MLLGVRVTAYAAINTVEHRRREAAGMGAVIHPGLLDRLMDLPAGIPVTDPVVWACREAGMRTSARPASRAVTSLASNVPSSRLGTR